MDVANRRRVVVKVKVMPNTTFEDSRPSSRPNSRPPSPARPVAHSPADDIDEEKHFRPRAKVNSSATSRKAPSIVSMSRASPRTGPENGTTTITLTPAPVTRPRTGPLSPTSIQPRVRSAFSSNLRPSSPTATELRRRSLTTTTSSPANSEVGRIADPRPKASLNHLSNAPSRPHSPTSSIGPPDFEASTSPPTRITSRVSVIKSNYDTLSPIPSPTPTPTPLATTRTASVRKRTPSTSSALSSVAQPSTVPLPQPNTFYPISTASPVANPHRYAPTRPIVRSLQPPYTQSQVQTRLRDDATPQSFNRPQPIAKVDPVSIPLPPQSPPVSILSYSSRSSALSHSSGSHAADSGSGESQSSSLTHDDRTNTTNPRLRATLDTLLQFTSIADGYTMDGMSGDSDRNIEEEHDTIHRERKVKAEAKSNRKIADLEITNKSLMAINATLEATKHRQAQEILDLKRKLRELRLILPPRTYRDVKSSLDHDDTEEDEDEVTGDAEDGQKEGDSDETYLRVKAMLEDLIQFGKTALNAKFEVLSTADKPVAKVLSATEVQDWRDGAESDENIIVTGDDGGAEDDVDDADDNPLNGNYGDEEDSDGTEGCMDIQGRGKMVDQQEVRQLTTSPIRPRSKPTTVGNGKPPMKREQFGRDSTNLVHPSSPGRTTKENGRLSPAPATKMRRGLSRPPISGSERTPRHLRANITSTRLRSRSPSPAILVTEST